MLEVCLYLVNVTSLRIPYENINCLKKQIRTERWNETVDYRNSLSPFQRPHRPQQPIINPSNPITMTKTQIASKILSPQLNRQQFARGPPIRRTPRCLPKDITFWSITVYKLRSICPFLLKQAHRFAGLCISTYLYLFIDEHNFLT